MAAYEYEDHGAAIRGSEKDADAYCEVDIRIAYEMSIEKTAEERFAEEIIIDPSSEAF